MADNQVPFVLGNGRSVTLSVTTTSARVALAPGKIGDSVVITNGTPTPCFITFGDSTVTAIAGGAANEGYWVLGNSTQSVTPGGPFPTHVAGITASGTTSVQFTVGLGA